MATLERVSKSIGVFGHDGGHCDGRRETIDDSSDPSDSCEQPRKEYLQRVEKKRDGRETTNTPTSRRQSPQGLFPNPHKRATLLSSLSLYKIARRGQKQQHNRMCSDLQSASQGCALFSATGILFMVRFGWRVSPEGRWSDHKVFGAS